MNSTSPADELARALTGKRCGSGYIARCPAHDDHNPSLSISESFDGKLLVHCFGGCAQEQVIGRLRELGLWPSSPPVQSRARCVSKSHGVTGATYSDAAHRIWHEARPVLGTAAETYLVSRGIDGPFPQCLRFHPRLKHPCGGREPAMVAAVMNMPGERVAIHRTFLKRDGSGKLLKRPKLMLGPCRGNSVQLAMPHSGILLVGEGIETCLAVMQATRLPAWAAMSAVGMKYLQIPPDVNDIIILADGDAVGENAARVLATRCVKEGRRARIARPPPRRDFNDILMQELKLPGTDGD